MTPKLIIQSYSINRTKLVVPKWHLNDLNHSQIIAMSYHVMCDEMTGTESSGFLWGPLWSQWLPCMFTLVDPQFRLVTYYITGGSSELMLDHRCVPRYRFTSSYRYFNVFEITIGSAQLSPSTTGPQFAAWIRPVMGWDMFVEPGMTRCSVRSYMGVSKNRGTPK